MKNFSYFKIAALVILISIFFSCSKNAVPQHLPKDPQIEHARKDSLAKVISGIYSGKTPCADCEGINYTVILNPSMDYITRSVYLGKDVKPYESTGKWSMIGDSIVVLESSSDISSYLQIVNNDSLYMLDATMKRITGPLESMFVLRRGDVNTDTAYRSVSEIQDSNYVLEVLNDLKIFKEDYTNDIPHLKFDIKKGIVYGSAGCNRLNGEVKISGNEISFLNLALTRMMCPGDGEAKFLSALKKAKTFKTENGKIYLMDGGKVIAILGKE